MDFKKWQKRMEMIKKRNFIGNCSKHILTMDGAMGTRVLSMKKLMSAVKFQDEQNQNFLESQNLMNEKLIEFIYDGYLKNGADIIKTNTFGSQIVGRYSEEKKEKLREINRSGWRIARKMADQYTQEMPEKQRFVAASIGSNKYNLKTKGDDGLSPSDSVLSVEEVHDSYLEQIRILLTNGVDLLLLESIYDQERGKIALSAAIEARRESGVEIPLILSFSAYNTEGDLYGYGNIFDFIKQMPENEVCAVGLNCMNDFSIITPIIERLAAETPYLICLSPNAGLPSENGTYPIGPTEMASQVEKLAKRGLLNFVGGCCGTDERHIREIQKVADGGKVRPAPLFQLL